MNWSLLASPVVNSSPLIGLSRAGMLDLLTLAGPRTLIPSAVLREVSAYGTDNITVCAVARADWLYPVETPRIPDHISSLRLGGGETAALAWALAHPGTVAILDEQRARRHAGQLGIPVRGTVGLILDG